MNDFLKPKLKAPQPGHPVMVNLKNATPKICKCGCKYFWPAVQVFIQSALASPTGQELTVQVPVLVCMDCKEVLK